MDIAYFIKAYFERSDDGYFYAGHSSNLGHSFSRIRRDAIAVNRYEMGQVIAGIMWQHEIYHLELILA